MKVLVAGAGAVGSLVGGLLSLRGCHVTLVARGEHGRTVAERGLILQHDWREGTWFEDARPPVVATVAAAQAEGPFAATLVAVKSYHTPQIAIELASLAQRTSIGEVVSLQNGVGNEARLAAAIPGTPVIAATVTLPAWIREPGTVATTDKGGVGFGADDATVRALAAALGGGTSVRLYPRQAEDMKWSKLLLNQLGASTSALLGWPPERVFADRRLFGVELAALRESLAVMRAKGLAPVSLPGYPVPLIAALAICLPEGLLHRVFSRRLAGGRGGRLPGVATDLAAGRHDTEMSVLGGAVGAAGAALGVPTPVTGELAALVLAAAMGHADRARYYDQPDALLARLRTRR